MPSRRTTSPRALRGTLDSSDARGARCDERHTRGSRVLSTLVLLGAAPWLTAGCGQASDVPPDVAEAYAAAGVTYQQCASFGANSPANDQAAFEYFVGKGLSPVQAAGIVGTFDGESGDNPKSSVGTNRGIAQWQTGGRWDTGGVTTADNVVAFAKSQGKQGQEFTLAVQLDFIWWELSTFPVFGLKDLKATTTVAAATSAFINGYEQSGTVPPTDPHVCWAQLAYQTYGSASPSTDGGTGSPSPGAGQADAGASGGGTGSPSPGTGQADAGASDGAPSSGAAGRPSSGCAIAPLEVPTGGAMAAIPALALVARCRSRRRRRP